MIEVTEPGETIEGNFVSVLGFDLDKVDRERFRNSLTAIEECERAADQYVAQVHLH
jgi:hypothetical protein